MSLKGLKRPKKVLKKLRPIKNYFFENTFFKTIRNGCLFNVIILDFLEISKSKKFNSEIKYKENF